MTPEEQIANLEARVAFQEEAIDQLSNAMAKQDRIILDLQQALRLMNDQLKKLSEPMQEVSADEPPPPHY
ncbi:SlyX family protein [Neptunomonas marina]|uniref:Protein SlyX homolog n=1 Tax=Neptunomonas marina TaxID=1815562 RepID=A0A437Q7B7_9GAMM|nr:SlyX family protein [Neptunomonas marina]RVU30397.1 SlyX family protein [Neptunomonas marina]